MLEFFSSKTGQIMGVSLILVVVIVVVVIITIIIMIIIIIPNKPQRSHTHTYTGTYTCGKALYWWLACGGFQTLLVSPWISETKPDMNKDKGFELNPIWFDLLRTTKLMNPG